MSISTTRIAVIGGGPAGLMAAEVLQSAGVAVAVYDGMPSVGRKFLLAGIGGMNITHSEEATRFVSRYAARSAEIGRLLQDFGPDALRAWIHDLGIETFVGSSGRVFPKEMKAAPLLRAWLQRLRAGGLEFHMRHRWQGWRNDALLFATPAGEKEVRCDAVVLALGGASWAKLGSDGAWLPLLEARGVGIAPLKPANCGFDIGWSSHFRAKFAGQPVKSVTAMLTDVDGLAIRRPGELMTSDTGIEGSLVYALARPLRELLERDGSATLLLDLAPGKSQERLSDEIGHPRGARSMASHLQSRAGIHGIKAGLLRECVAAADYQDPETLARRIKALPLKLMATRPLDEAISTAGGVKFEALDAGLMLRDVPGVFCAGEMLDWEAPTGGYLLTACFASGRAAGLGVLGWLKNKKENP